MLQLLESGDHSQLSPLALGSSLPLHGHREKHELIPAQRPADQDNPGAQKKIHFTAHTMPVPCFLNGCAGHRDDATSHIPRSVSPSCTLWGTELPPLFMLSPHGDFHQNCTLCHLWRPSQQAACIFNGSMCYQVVLSPCKAVTHIPGTKYEYEK